MRSNLSLKRRRIPAARIENDVAAGDDAFDILQTDCLKHLFELVHLYDVTTNVDCAEKGNVFHELTVPASNEPRSFGGAIKSQACRKWNSSSSSFTCASSIPIHPR